MEKINVRAAVLSTAYVAAIVLGVCAVLALLLINSTAFFVLFFVGVASFFLYGAWLSVYEDFSKDIPPTEANN